MTHGIDMALLAATFHRAGIKRIISNNESDYKVLGVFEVVTFKD